MNSYADTSAAILVLGIGNLVMGDDGAGVRVVQELQKRYLFPPPRAFIVIACRARWMRPNRRVWPKR